jgi:hypothetical protein
MYHLNPGIDRMATILRESRFKYGYDYAVLDERQSASERRVHVLTSRVWQPAIEEAAEECGVTIDRWHFIDEG